MGNTYDDLNNYKDKWEAALKDGFLEKSPHLPEPKSSADFFGQWDGSEGDDVPLNECDAKYWQEVYKRSSHQGECPDLTEEVKATKEQIKKHVERAANSANPVYPDSVGKDQGPVVTKNWTDGKELRGTGRPQDEARKAGKRTQCSRGYGEKGQPRVRSTQFVNK
jgi:hypothetical protein